MLDVEMIVLMASAKYGNYCIAGVDVHSGRWYRLVTDDSESHGALTAQDLIAAGGHKIQPLDQIRVRGTQTRRGRLQTENILVSRERPLEFVRRASVSDVLEIHRSEQRPHVFLNTHYLLWDSELSSLHHSLELMVVEDLLLYIRVGGYKCKMDFTFDGKRYAQFAVTDPDCFDISSAEVLRIPRAMVVFSLADDEWSRSNGHYKYVAKIFRLDGGDDR